MSNELQIGSGEVHRHSQEVEGGSMKLIEVWERLK